MPKPLSFSTAQWTRSSSCCPHGRAPVWVCCLSKRSEETRTLLSLSRTLVKMWKKNMHTRYLLVTPNFPGQFLWTFLDRYVARTLQLLSASQPCSEAALTTLKSTRMWDLDALSLCVCSLYGVDTQRQHSTTPPPFQTIKMSAWKIISQNCGYELIQWVWLTGC